MENKEVDIIINNIKTLWIRGVEGVPLSCVQPTKNHIKLISVLE